MTAIPRRLKRARDLDGEVIAVLDLGSHKVCCLICLIEPVVSPSGERQKRIRTLGGGYHRSTGISCGAVVDLRQAQSAIAAAVSQAEHAAGLRIEQVVVAAGCGDPRSRTFNGQVRIVDGAVQVGDIARLDAGAREYAVRDGSVLLSLNRLEFTLDDNPPIREPRGLCGQNLQASHHAVVAHAGAMRNLGLAIESCQLATASSLPAGYASAIAATTPVERNADVVAIDIGAESTKIAAFVHGHFVYHAVVPFGGQHVTQELAHELGLPLAEAERIKTLYGSLVVTASDEHQLVPVVCERDLHEVPTLTRARVGRVVIRAMRTLLMQVRRSLDQCSISRIGKCQIVLTGGASETLGLDLLAVDELARPVRLAGPAGIDGKPVRLAGCSPGPWFACVAGLALAAALPSPWIAEPQYEQPNGQSYLGRVEQWLRQSF